jgi:hypothetical protein
MDFQWEYKGLIVPKIKYFYWKFGIKKTYKEKTLRVLIRGLSN